MTLRCQLDESRDRNGRIGSLLFLSLSVDGHDTCESSYFCAAVSVPLSPEICQDMLRGSAAAALKYENAVV